MTNRFTTVGYKDDSNKIRLELISPEFLLGLGRVLTHGSKKYSEWNWARGMFYSRVFGALLRHLWDWYRGEDLDADSGEHHLDHAACCLMFLRQYTITHREFDDRPNFDQLKVVPDSEKTT